MAIRKNNQVLYIEFKSSGEEAGKSRQVKMENASHFLSNTQPSPVDLEDPFLRDRRLGTTVLRLWGPNCRVCPRKELDKAHPALVLEKQPPAWV